MSFTTISGLGDVYVGVVDIALLDTGLAVNAGGAGGARSSTGGWNGSLLNASDNEVEVEVDARAGASAMSREADGT